MISKNKKVRYNTGAMPKGERQVEGTRIELQIEAAINGSGAIEMTRIPIYPDKQYGVLPETDIRTDRMEVLRDAVGMANQKYIEAHNLRLQAKFQPETPKEPSGSPDVAKGGADS